MPSEIEIEIAPDGTVRAAVSGIPGPDCKERLNELTALLGLEVSFEPSSEYYQTAEEIDGHITGRYN